MIIGDMPRRTEASCMALYRCISGHLKNVEFIGYPYVIAIRPTRERSNASKLEPVQCL